MIDINFDYSKVKGSTQLHNKFKAEFMLAVCDKYPYALPISYDVGVFRAFSEPDKIVRCGFKGALDVIVELPKATLWFDMKTGSATLQSNQKMFVNNLENIKGHKTAFKIKTVKEGLDIIETFR